MVTGTTVVSVIFSEREVRYMSSPFRLSRLYVTFVRPSQAIGIFGNVSTPFGRPTSGYLPSVDILEKILRRSSQRTHLYEVKRKRGSQI